MVETVADLCVKAKKDAENEQEKKENKSKRLVELKPVDLFDRAVAQAMAKKTTQLENGVDYVAMHSGESPTACVEYVKAKGPTSQEQAKGK